MRTDSMTLSEPRSRRRARRRRASSRRRDGAGGAAPVRAQGRERAGGPRGDPPGRRRRSARPRELARELSRDELALYDLIFKRTIASQMKDASGQTVSIDLGATTEDGDDAEFRASGTVITFPGFLHAYESGRDEPSEDDEERRLPALSVGQELDARARAAGPRDEPARPLHRGEPRQGARGSRHRPAVDVRVDHGHDPRPRLRLQEGHGARPDVPRVRGDPAARAALRPARRLRLHGAHGGRPRPHRGRRRGAGRLAHAASTSATATRACTRSSPTISTRSTRAR